MIIVSYTIDFKFNLINQIDKNEVTNTQNKIQKFPNHSSEKVIFEL
jgi:hypothetical protein